MTDLIAVATTSAGIWRHEDTIVAQSTAKFPPCCVSCGSTDNCRPIRYNIRCQPPVWFILIPYLAPFFSSASIRPQLCRTHHKAEINSRRLGHLLFAFAVGMMLVPFVFLRELMAISEAFFILPLLGLLFLLIWVYYRTWRYKVLVANEIRGSKAIIRSCTPWAYRRVTHRSKCRQQIRA